MKAIPFWKVLKDNGICKTTGEAKNEIRQRSIKVAGITVTENHYLVVDEIEGNFIKIIEITNA
jgi:tyrosyl-tRNA synthetase